MSRAIGVSVPANLLLLGEYTVTEEGGLGITVALEKRAVVTVEKSDTTRIESIYQENQVSEVSIHDTSNLAAYILTSFGQFPGVDRSRLNCRLVVDTSAFFDSHGAKLGFGSSAAVAVGVCAVLKEWFGLDSKPGLPLLAHQLHKEFQDGRGSGYDIFTSYFGGTGVFTGGDAPLYERIDNPWFNELWLYSSHTPVASSGAISAYNAWKTANPDSHERFFSESNRNVRVFVGAKDAATVYDTIRTGAVLGTALGTDIGIPAGLKCSVPDGTAAKSVGAGNELAVLVPESGHKAPSGRLPVSVSSAGITWL